MSKSKSCVNSNRDRATERTEAAQTSHHRETMAINHATSNPPTLEALCMIYWRFLVPVIQLDMQRWKPNTEHKPEYITLTSTILKRLLWQTIKPKNIFSLSIVLTNIWNQNFEHRWVSLESCLSFKLKLSQKQLQVALTKKCSLSFNSKIQQIICKWRTSNYKLLVHNLTQHRRSFPRFTGFY